MTPPVLVEVIRASHATPYSRGESRRWERLPLNTSAPASAPIPRAAPITVERIGTADRPRPGSRARRTPAATGGGIDARASASPRAVGPVARASSAVEGGRAARQLG